MKKTVARIVIFLALAGTIAWQHQRLRKFRAENHRLENNMTVLQEGCRQYRVRDSLWAAGTGRLEMQIAEYRKRRQEDSQLIENLKIRLKRVESTSRHVIETRHEIISAVRDTVFLADSVRYFEYASPHIDLRGWLRKDSVEIALTSYDTLLQVVHRIPKRFLFFRYGTKAIRQEVVSKNPHTRIAFTEYIQLKKESGLP